MGNSPLHVNLSFSAYLWCAADQAALCWCTNVCFILDCASMGRLNTPCVRRYAGEVFPSSPPDLSQQDT